MKANQKANFSRLWDYCVYGPYNPSRNQILPADLRKMDPQELINLLGALDNIEHTVFYYGPYSEKQLNSLLAKEHKTGKNSSLLHRARSTPSSSHRATRFSLLPTRLRTSICASTRTRVRLSPTTMLP